MKQIFFFDIDGTMIDQSRGLKEISSRTKYAIQELKKDSYVFIATGRSPILANDFVSKVSPSGCIYCNGALAYLEGKLLFEKCFTYGDAYNLNRIVKKYEGFAIMERKDATFIDNLNNKLFLQFDKDWELMKNGICEKSEVFDDINMAMIGFPDKANALAAEKELSEYCHLDRFYETLSYDAIIKDVSKGFMAKKLILHFNIPLVNSYAFGDSVNDLQMLEAVGHPVIMKNANEMIRNYGFEQTDDVIDDGIYNYLVKNKLIKPLGVC